MVIERISHRLRDFRRSLEYRQLARQNSFDPERALIISGDPRGGTTWLSEIVNQLPDTALLWEPLAISNVSQFKRLGFGWREFIPEDARWPEAKAAFDKLLAGKLLNAYLAQYTTPSELWRARFLAIKFCRASQLLPWLTNEYHFKRPPIYVVRHPCAVVASQLRHGAWNRVKPVFDIPSGRYESFFTPHQEFLSKINTIEKRLAAFWCLCNTVPLSHPDNNRRWITINYESLVRDPRSQLERIEDRWQWVFPDDVYNNIMKASKSTIAGSPVVSGRRLEQISYWKKQLAPKQIADIMSTLEYFDIKVYDSSEYPKIEY